MSEARLYYEAHVTVKGKNVDKDWAKFNAVAEHNGFRASRFDVDEVDHYDGAWFLSYRTKRFDEMKDAIRSCLGWLRLNGYEVIRWKIEDTVLDSKHGDTLDG